MRKVFWIFASFCLLCAPRAGETKTLLVVGDSIAAGYGVDPDEAFPALLGRKIEAAGLGYKVVNAGVSGDTTAGGLRRINWLLRQAPDAVLLELGGNDGLRGISPEETEKNLQGIIEKIRQKNADTLIIIAGMQMPANMGEEYTTKYREVFSRVAKENAAALIPFLLEKVGGNPELNLPDRIHPTAEGHKIVAETVWKTVGPLLKRADKQVAEAH